MKKNNEKNQKGVTILVAIMILSSVVILALAVADIVGRSNRSSKDIGLSEVAYFAAERGVEETLYSIERGRTISGLDGGSGVLTDIVGASWQRTISILTDAEAGGMNCDVLYPASPGPDTPLSGLCVDETTPNQPKTKVKLPAGDSFQLELDFLGLEDYLPNGIRIDGIDDDNASTTIFNVIAGTMTTPTHLNNVDIPSQGAVLKITNKSAATEDIEINSIDSGHADIPLSILVTATGIYKEQTRKIEVERKNWQIY
ncbi:MAG: hypothetical protein PHT40_04050 [Patescibacteria group bacterium]|nr:hypothetical protein [Patescibacteria group bacterium]